MKYFGYREADDQEPPLRDVAAIRLRGSAGARRSRKLIGSGGLLCADTDQLDVVVREAGKAGTKEVDWR